jgi:hypothetical protein
MQNPLFKTLGKMRVMAKLKLGINSIFARCCSQREQTENKLGG